MAKPAPDDQSVSWIEISDFSPGIVSDQHGSLAPRFTASETMKGALPLNGVARADGTFRCRADKTGALVPLPRAQPTGVRDIRVPWGGFVDRNRPFRYVLDAQVGTVLVDGTEDKATAFPDEPRFPIQVMFGFYRQYLTFYNAVVIGREYRPWETYIGGFTASLQPVIDFLFAFTVPFDLATAVARLPIGSLCRARFYYGNTAQGKVDAGTDRSFRPLWSYPVCVAMAATPLFRWGSGNRWTSTFGGFVSEEPSQYGLTMDVADPLARTTPSIGLNGLGTCQIAMQLADEAIINLPFPTKFDRWYFHYSERGNVPQNNILDDIAGGPINPYMIVAHQGRVVMPDRRRMKGGFAENSNSALKMGYANDLLWYSPLRLPTSDTAITPLVTDKGQANAAYGEWPITTQEPYSKLEVALDSVSDIGTVGVVTVDQLLVVKHFGGGALISGDLDQPTIQRLPYIEPTSGLICKGVLTPIGFVYGSPRGIFVWDGGETTDKLSSQLDGFFWNHTDSDLNGSLLGEQYAGSRGRMGYWNGLICVPNNYVYDVENKSWWRLATQLLSSQGIFAAPTPVPSPYNCYDVDERGVLYAFPYRHHAMSFVESNLVFPDNPVALNCVYIADAVNFSAQPDLDIRFCAAGTAAGAVGADRTVMSHWQATGDQRSWNVGFTSANKMYIETCTNGAVGTVIRALCDVATGATAPMCYRITWRSSDGRVQFFWKGLGQDVKSALRSSLGWSQQGADKVAATAALHNSTEAFVIGNLGNDALSLPIRNSFGPFFPPRIYGIHVGALGGPETNPKIELVPNNIPSNTDSTGAFITTFDFESGQPATIVRASGNERLATDKHVLPSPVWYTFEQDDLDVTYTWQSHPLIETRGKKLSVQYIEMLVTGLVASNNPSTVTVELQGLNQDGSSVGSKFKTFILANTDQPQILEGDFPAFKAAYITVKLLAVGGGLDDAGLGTQVPAPKIHSVRIATRDRETFNHS